MNFLRWPRRLRHKQKRKRKQKAKTQIKNQNANKMQKAKKAVSMYDPMECPKRLVPVYDQKYVRPYTECKYGGSLGRPGSTCAKARLLRPRVCFDNASFEYESIEYLLCSRSVLYFFDMVTSCCVPECNQKG